MVPHVKDNNRLSTQKTVSLDFEEDFFKIDPFKPIVAADVWLKYCRYGVKHYPINQLAPSPRLKQINGNLHLTELLKLFSILFLRMKIFNQFIFW